MASAAAASKASDRPSFAKIAASGIKSSNVQQALNNSTSNTMLTDQLTTVQSQPDCDVAPPHGSDSCDVVAKPRQLAQLVGQDFQDPKQPSTSDPAQSAQGRHTLRAEKPHLSNEERPVPTSSDEAGTQVSSSNDSTKPASVDGRSITSGTTFALDEKESLRPDDSASVKAAEEEDSVPGLGSDDGIRAFRDQLREINTINHTRRGAPGVFTTGTASKGVLYVPPPESGVGARPDVVQPVEPSSGNVSTAPDHKLLEALESPRDRIWVLKLEQDIIDFVKDAKESSLNLPQCNSFYRMLAHKIADYYMLDHFVDESAAAVRLHKTPNCRIPPPLTGITTPSTAASTPPPSGPQLKILRRGEGGNLGNGSNMTSNANSDAGESGEDDKKPKPPQSREEREARYEAARLRIMGSAKPSESPEAIKDESRASSTTGKKTRKPKRTNSDDDFEPRTNFNSYFANGNSTPTFVQEPVTIANQASAYAGYNNPNPVDLQAFQQGAQAFSPQVTSDNNWQYQAFNGNEAPPAWNSNYQSQFDLSTEFQRSMSFAQPVYQGNGQMQFAQDGAFAAPGHSQQQMWASQQYASPYPQAQSNVPQGYSPAYSPRPSSSASQQGQYNQPYLYGQLPSQTFPGRQPSKFEHPLPGSYHGQHFNPQSQSFIPNQPNGPSFSPMGLQRNLSNGSNYSNAIAGHPTAQRQVMAHAQQSTHGSPQALSNAPLHARYPNQPMAHPLPQPVFPRAPSPAVPLPPRPQILAQRLGDQHNGPSSPNSSNGNAQGNNTVSKWGVPASLPAKPPPSRVPSGGVPTFGVMPHVNGGISPYTSSQQ
ncbi:hypothetical protein K431DRAFT_294272 [Polychaeton citri CBS 116435]|uniref:SUZ domain-containing protein n=1 Tax=Polychaeton citri CBS 116435 TaxID=1314669 RepID=A0A9P4QB68_9PEZI|nr:hypothetical protein K431DRAFT_294272 [Polychaeton citri CBS 116435]